MDRDESDREAKSQIYLSKYSNSLAAKDREATVVNLSLCLFNSKSPVVDRAIELYKSMHSNENESEEISCIRRIWVIEYTMESWILWTAINNCADVLHERTLRRY